MGTLPCKLDGVWEEGSAGWDDEGEANVDVVVIVGAEEVCSVLDVGGTGSGRAVLRWEEVGSESMACCVIWLFGYVVFAACSMEGA